MYAPPPAQTEIPPAVPVDDPKRIGIFLDPLNVLLGTLGAELSYSPALPVAINVGFQYRKDDVGNDPLSNAKIELTQLGIRAGAQIFPTTDRSMRGFYLYPRGTVVFGSTNATQFYDEASTSGLELVGMAGYQWRWRNGFAIRLGGGLGYRKIEVELKPKNAAIVSSGANKAGREGAALAAEFALGWCF